MTVISSFRPLDKSPTIARNQLRAKQSWEGVFDSIMYFNAPDERMASPKTVFIDSEDFPHMSALFLAAAMTDDITAIVNADIVCMPALRGVIEREIGRGAGAMMSFRMEFDPERPDYVNAKQVDNGLDFFCTVPEIWHMAYKFVSQEYRISGGKWDTWLMNFLHVTLSGRFFPDITHHRCIFHPKHGEREFPYYISPIDDAFCIGGFRG